MPAPRLTDLSRERRLALGLFLLLLVGFYGLAQVKLVTAVSGGAGFPGPRQVLERYHGDRTKSRFHTYLEPGREKTDPLNMYQFLGGADAEKPARRASILAWVEAGTPRDGWRAVAPILASVESCAECHSATRVDGEARARADLPFDTYDDVVAAARLDTGMSLTELATSAHNHMMGFAVVALLSAWAFTATRWRGAIVPLLILGAFGGAALDVASWWLTHYAGHPYEYGVIAGGGAFGACVMAMVVLTLDELWLGGFAGGLAAKATGALRLGRRDPA